MNPSAVSAVSLLVCPSYQDWPQCSFPLAIRLGPRLTASLWGFLLCSECSQIYTTMIAGLSLHDRLQILLQEIKESTISFCAAL